MTFSRSFNTVIQKIRFDVLYMTKLERLAGAALIKISFRFRVFEITSKLNSINKNILIIKNIYM